MSVLRLLGALALVIPAGFASGQTPADAPPPPEDRSVVTVTGTARVEAEPDRARIHFAVETQGDSAEEAAQANARQMTSVSDAIRGSAEDVAGFRIETSGYSLTPRYGPIRVDRSRDIVGYTAMNTIRVTIDDLEPVGSLIDTALSSGANRVSHLQFEIRDPEPVRHAALREAVRKAHAEARVIAEALDMPLGPALDVQGGADTPAWPMPYGITRTMEAADAATTPIEIGTEVVSAHVTIRFRLGAAP